VLTGAGISAESGLKTFRGADGWWRQYRAEELATPEAFARDPGLVQEFYNLRRQMLLAPEISPNAAHTALAKFEDLFQGQFTLVTQNIDDLHERAGSRRLLHMHGELLKKRCQHCGWVDAVRSDIGVKQKCTRCAKTGGLRPHVVWFGEVPLHLEDISARLQDCDLFVSIGTSGNVYPAAGFVQLATAAGALTVEINLEPSETMTMFEEKIYGSATETVPAYLGSLLD